MSTIDLSLVRRALPEITRLWFLPFPELKRLRAKHNPESGTPTRHLTKAQCIMDILFREEPRDMAATPDYQYMLALKDDELKRLKQEAATARADANTMEKLYHKERSANGEAYDKISQLIGTMRQLMTR